MMKEYFHIDLLKNLYLEDSYLLRIVENIDSLEFFISAVLTEQHPKYSSPKSNEQYCYQNLAILFQNISELKWENKKLEFYTDTDGIKDLGNIDFLFFDENNNYKMGGDFGQLFLNAKEISLNSFD